MNTNGIRLFTRAYNAASTAGNPARVQIQIGKGLKGTSLELYKSTGKDIAGATTTTYVEGAIQYGPRMTSYNATTGILTLDAGYNATGITTHLFEFNDLSNQNNGYFVINASKNVSLVGIGLNRIAARGVNSSGQSIPNSGGPHIVTFNATKDYDTNGALNAATGEFTAPETGYYEVSGAVYFSSSAYAIGNEIRSFIFLNGNRYAFGNITTIDRAVTFEQNSGVSTGMFLKKGDVLTLRVSNSRTAGATTLSPDTTANYFSISKVSV
jgi:hypothetical protein